MLPEQPGSALEGALTATSRRFMFAVMNAFEATVPIPVDGPT